MDYQQYSPATYQNYHHYGQYAASGASHLKYLMTKTAAMHLQNREMVGHHQINHAAGAGLNASGSAAPGDARVNGTDGGGNALASDEGRTGGSNVSDGKPHQCHQCLKSFTSNHQLVQHLRVHTGEKPYKCSYCERRFKQLSHVQQHTRLHTGERPYKCHVPDCGRAFIQLSNLQQHLRNHESQLERLKNRPFHCNVCGKGFATESSLRTHNGKHTTLVGGPNPACCPLCQKICLSGEGLMEHMKFVHKDPNASGVPVKRRNANHPCPVCGKFYVNEGSLRKHLTCHPEMAGQLNSSLRMWPCSVCTAVFTHENGLVNHMDQMRMDPKHQFAAQFVLSRAANERRERDALLAAAAVNMSHFAMTAGLASGLGGCPTTGHHHIDSPARISTPANMKEQAIASASRSSLGLHHPQGVSQGQQMLDFYGRMNGDISSVMANGGLRSDAAASLNNGMTNQHHLASPHNHHQVAAESVSKIATEDFYGGSSNNNNNSSTNKCVQ